MLAGPTIKHVSSPSMILFRFYQVQTAGHTCSEKVAMVAWRKQDHSFYYTKRGPNDDDVFKGLSVIDTGGTIAALKGDVA